MITLVVPNPTRPFVFGMISTIQTLVIRFLFGFQVWQMAENIYNDEEVDTSASEVEGK